MNVIPLYPKKFVSYKMRKLIYSALSSYLDCPEESLKNLSSIIEQEIVYNFWIKSKNQENKLKKVV